MNPSTFTPVRVRGKKRRDMDESSTQTSLPSKLRTRGHPRKAHSDSLHSRSPTSQLGEMRDVQGERILTKNLAVSRLEQLPTELLQEIFLLSTNCHLPTASLHLRNALSSFQVKYLFLIHVFSDKPTTSHPISHAMLESAVLRKKFMTYRFIRDCQRIYMKLSAIKLFRKVAMNSSRIVQDVAIKDIEKAFDLYFCHSSWYRKIKSQVLAHPEEPWDGDGRFKWKGEGDTHFEFELSRDGGHLQIRSSKTEHGGSISDEPDAHESLDIHDISLLERLHNCKLPEKLLHGPWTQEKGDFLMYLLNAGVRLDWLYSIGGEVATVGLEDAIRECCLPAVMALVSGDCGKITAIKDPDPTGKWYAISKMQIQVAVGVTPTTKHLKMAIRGQSDQTAGILYLLTRSYKTEINPDDPEIIGWALEHMAEGNGDTSRAPLVTQERSADGRFIDKWTVTGQTVLADLEYVRHKIRAQ